MVISTSSEPQRRLADADADPTRGTLNPPPAEISLLVVLVEPLRIFVLLCDPLNTSFVSVTASYSSRFFGSKSMMLG